MQCLPKWHWWLEGNSGRDFEKNCNRAYIKTIFFHSIDYYDYVSDYGNDVMLKTDMIVVNREEVIMVWRRNLLFTIKIKRHYNIYCSNVKGFSSFWLDF